MKTLIPYKLEINKTFNEDDLLKGLYIAVIHATRIPPHIGIIADKQYHSLSIKGQNINTSVNALLKNSTIRKIPTLFIKIKGHMTFSDAYLNEHFITNVQQFQRVDTGVATCLSPIKLFFEETYDVPMKEINYLYDLLPALHKEGLIEHISSLFVDEKKYQLPFYTSNEINEGIDQIRSEFK
ncbi:MAG: hypothetical protein H0W84_12785 [Bacteroidetes bacterium]|nr:hypothetical protein [Bacteroidota bacterium]